MPTAIAIGKADGPPGQVYYPLKHVDVAQPVPGEDEVLVRVAAAALNHRDLFIRQNQYPGVAFDVPLLADGCGQVVATGSSAAARAWLHARVLLNPGAGWAAATAGPEPHERFSIRGGTRSGGPGTLCEYVSVAAADVHAAPAHLSSAEAAALPLAGLTAWRAVTTKCPHAGAGRNVLVTGIGGGVALMALAFAVAAGARVYVTSGQQWKLARACQLGATAGVLYTHDAWHAALLDTLPPDRPYLDAIIDGAGGNIVEKACRLLKPGGIVVSYGMTLGPVTPFPMAAVLRNIDLRGSTMGSRSEFHDMVDFVDQNKLRPVVSRVVSGLTDLPAIDQLFDDMKNGTHFGKLVVQISAEEEGSRL